MDDCGQFIVISGTVLLLWSIVWIIIGADNPAKARGIPNHEREFIENNTENRDEVKVREDAKTESCHEANFIATT